MTRTRFALGCAVASAVCFAAPAMAQSAGVQHYASPRQVRAAVDSAPAAPHTIVIDLVDRSGPKPYAFDPPTVTAHRGDTLRFVQLTSAIHDVHFKAVPRGAKLGSATTGPYLTTKGQVYTIVVDSRFVDGSYEVVCDPHEMIGMHEFITVTTSGAAPVAATDKGGNP